MMVLEWLERTIRNPNHPNTEHESVRYSNGFSIRAPTVFRSLSKKPWGYKYQTIPQPDKFEYQTYSAFICPLYVIDLPEIISACIDADNLSCFLSFRLKSTGARPCARSILRLTWRSGSCCTIRKSLKKPSHLYARQPKTASCPKLR